MATRCQYPHCEGLSDVIYTLVDTSKAPFNKTRILCEECTSPLSITYRWKCDLCDRLMSSTGITHPFHKNVHYCFECVLIDPVSKWRILPSDVVEMKRLYGPHSCLRWERKEFVLAHEIADLGLTKARTYPPSWVEKLRTKINRALSEDRKKRMAESRRYRARRTMNMVQRLTDMIPEFSEAEATLFVREIDFDLSPEYLHSSFDTPDKTLRWLLSARSLADKSVEDDGSFLNNE